MLQHINNSNRLEIWSKFNPGKNNLPSLFYVSPKNGLCCSNVGISYFYYIHKFIYE
ncbi:hypothetical protein CNEO3_30103 [Clostridium neonatale]|nr:hypothetical protein CNEO3_20103 [Clostridium neonatale]CAI3666357.1 hypothetical protein CNEO3_30103 [Clostridium neonatale]CAI3685129.1 hypothetical protein CNEO3_40103 [Clostridium neonatale]CAI3722404.1 hypothetical protein CNEO4_90160 [Clostridium neonatale]CAI3729357.1 hypothetical protein CNEO3_40103 [Clostridium neonatale]